ncbi:MAG: CBS domain-containing protein, partial [Bacteroidia bacterium]
MAGLLQMKNMFKKDDVVVVIFHDHGTRYLGKMFNDDWMRDRGFLDSNKPKAVDLISSHASQKLMTVKAEDKIADAVAMMTKYNISQVPVKKGNEFVGALNDSYVFGQLIADDKLKQQTVDKVMQKPFPFVGMNAGIDEVSKLITKENNAVLLKDRLGEVHIITKHDIIQSLSK